MVKVNFWNSGFATFEDMSLIAKGCLKKTEIATRITKKFPLIIVDECQDTGVHPKKILL